MDSRTLTGHPDDGALLRLLDGEDDGDTAAAREHVATCADCRRRLATLRRRGERLAVLLARTDFPVPASAPGPVGEVASDDAIPAIEASPSSDAKVIPLRRRTAAASTDSRRTWLRAAAIVLLVLGVGVVATPARAWIAAFLSDLMGGGDPAPVETPVAPPTVDQPPAAPAASSSVRFVPAGSTFRIDVAHEQAAGGLTLLRAEGESATAEVLGGEADLLVLPSGLRIGNRAGSAADYRVSVPAGVRRVTVRVGGGAPTTVDAAEIGAEGRRIGL